MTTPLIKFFKTLFVPKSNINLDNRFFLMLLITIISCIFSLKTQHEYINYSFIAKETFKTAFFGFSIYFLSYFILSYVKNNRISNFLKNTFLILVCLFGIVDIFNAYYFNMPISTIMIQTILATNPSEAKAFFDSVILARPLIFIFYIVFLCSFLYFMRCSVQISLKKACFISSFFVLAIFSHAFKSLITQHTLYYTTNTLANSTPLTKSLYAFYLAKTEQVGLKFLENLNKFSKKDYLSVEENPIANVVLIIGESASKNFMQLYGYNAPNNPLLSTLANERERERERVKNPSLYIFKNVVSSEAFTLENFTRLLTYSDYENRDTQWYQFNNLGNIFKQANYKTFDLDNQESLRALEPKLTPYYLLSLPFDMAFNYNNNWHVLDEWLIHGIKNKILPNLETNNFILLHLMGSHGTYNERFPKTFAKFKPSDLSFTHLHVNNDKDKQIVADYVNSLYYNDYILNEIFNLFKDKDAIVFYLSDHAQDMFESGSTYGHKCSKAGVEIPFMIYVSDIFKEKHPKKIALIKNAVNKPFMSDDLIHSLLPLVGIHTKDAIESKNLFSPKFDTTRKRIFCNSINYDAIKE
ncbi:phosphoethanolamine transferase [Helicobacter cetorum]|uniref:phosphoethanolamine transferase n=1 Tax=Helicobacter cetorum TaxID=138563 RepID=UPI000CF19E6F|nr:phosphoethanolamine transferase [Helicobacter cetorum]